MNPLTRFDSDRMLLTMSDEQLLDVFTAAGALLANRLEAKQPRPAAKILRLIGKANRLMYQAVS